MTLSACLTLAAAVNAAQATPPDTAVTVGMPYEVAKARLAALVAAEPRNAGAVFLLGRIVYALRDYDGAAEWFRKAVALSPSSSPYHLWLGRATAARVSRVSVFRKASLAREAREGFQTAVRLNPANIDARRALLSFFLEAPPIAGGSRDLAYAQQREITALDPVRGHLALACIRI